MAAAQFFGRQEILQIFVIGKHLDLLRGTLQVVAPLNETGFDRLEFLVLKVIVAFGGRKLAGIKRDRVDAIGKLLRQNAGEGDIGGVRLDDDRQRGIEMAKKRLFQENVSDRRKGGLLLRTPLERGARLQKLGQGGGDLCKIGQETAVKIHETQKRLDIADFFGGRPFFKGQDFFFAHLEASAADTEAKKVNGGLMERAFFERGEQVPLAEGGKHLANMLDVVCLLYTSPSPRDGLLSRMPSSA